MIEGEKFSRELHMKHHDGRGSPEVQQVRALASKEASFVQAVGYDPSVNIPSHEWMAMERRNEMSKGEYKPEFHPHYRK